MTDTGTTRMTSYKVMNGCCSFYEGDDCKSKFMFDAYNRSDERLGNVCIALFAII